MAYVLFISEAKLKDSTAINLNVLLTTVWGSSSVSKLFSINWFNEGYFIRIDRFLSSEISVVWSFGLTTFISHTVSAIIVMPLIAEIGVSAGNPALMVFTCALATSSAMALPMTSFPNVNSLLAEDDFGNIEISST